MKVVDEYLSARCAGDFDQVCELLDYQVFLARKYPKTFKDSIDVVTCDYFVAINEKMKDINRAMIEKKGTMPESTNHNRCVFNPKTVAVFENAAIISERNYWYYTYQDSSGTWRVYWIDSPQPIIKEDEVFPIERK